MSPNYGSGAPGKDTAADWLFGGHRKRRIIEVLTNTPGIRAIDIERKVGCTRVTVFETLRVLRAIGAVDQPSRGRYQLVLTNDIGSALAALVEAARPLADTYVDRPPRRRQTRRD